jgi:hypothetical protein
MSAKAKWLSEVFFSPALAMATQRHVACRTKDSDIDPSFTCKVCSATASIYECSHNSLGTIV